MIGPIPLAAYTISVNLIISHRVILLTALISKVSLHGVYPSIFHLLHDTHMIGRTILRARKLAWVVIAICNPPLLLSS